MEFAKAQTIIPWSIPWHQLHAEPLEESNPLLVFNAQTNKNAKIKIKIKIKMQTMQSQYSTDSDR